MLSDETGGLYNNESNSQVVRLRVCAALQKDKARCIVCLFVFYFIYSTRHGRYRINQAVPKEKYSVDIPVNLSLQCIQVSRYSYSRTYRTEKESNALE